MFADKNKGTNDEFLSQMIYNIRFNSIISQQNCDQYQKECKLSAITKLLPEIIWFANVPVLERDRPAISHPEKGSFLSLIGTGRPKVFMTETEVLDMLLKPVVLLL